MKKSNKKGFTLVELVVVIAIIGVLAAILVPSMLNYVKKSRLKTANSNAKTAYNAVSEYISDQETQGVAPSTAMGDFGTDYIDCTAEQTDDGKKQVYNALAENGSEAGGVWVFVASINGVSDAPVVQWAKTADDEMIGQYPNAVSWDDWNENGAPTGGTFYNP